MPHRVICSWCEIPLRVDEAIRTAFVTCPHCLARIPNPGVPESAGAGASPVAELAGTVDDEVRRDTRGIGCGLIALAVVGGLGILQSLLVAVAQREPEYVISLCIGLVFLTLVGTGITLARTRKDPRARTVGRMVLGTLALAGALMLGSFALMILFFIVCVVALLSGGMRI